MSRWRPGSKIGKNNIYIIPDTHGKYNEIQLILDRILPLKIQDKLIFLGDYIDRSVTSDLVIDTLISLKNDFPENIIFLRGNHEYLFLSICNRINKIFMPEITSDYYLWMTCGGDKTLLSYARRKNIDLKNPYELTIDRAISFIDKEHLDFIEKNTITHYELNNYGNDYIFVHAGCDPNIPLNQQDEYDFMWDRSLYSTVKKIKLQGKNLPWNKTVITGHNFDGPYITDRFMMLDASEKDVLLVTELNSMECFGAYPGNNRLVKYHLNKV